MCNIVSINSSFFILPGARTKPVWKDVRFLPRNNSSPQVVKAPTTKYSARYRSSSVQAETKPQRKRIPSRREINAPVTKGNRQPIIATKVRRHSATDGTCSKAKPATQHDTRRTQILTKVPMPRKPKLSASRSLASKTTIRMYPGGKFVYIILSQKIFGFIRNFSVL